MAVTSSCCTEKPEKCSLLPSKTENSSGRPFWWVDGKPYDLSRFMHRHPGGSIWFKLNKNRDISNLFHTYHADPVRCQAVLAKYLITDDPSCGEGELLCKLGIPPFLLPAAFDAKVDIPKYNFHDPTHLLPRVREVLSTPEYKTKLKLGQLAFDACFFMTLTLYVLNFYAWMTDRSPGFLSLALMVMFRTWFGAFGHYYVHGKKPNISECVFDLNYVGTNMTAFDGHVMLHHAYTHTGADIKTSIFGGMWNLPPLLRFPGFTVHKLGQTLSGMLIRAYEFICLEYSVRDFHWSIWVMRTYVMLEVLIFAAHGKTLEFLVQFTLTLWLNTFLVLSSHDFEEFESVPATPRQDWGYFQVENSHDLTLVGNRWLDVLFSAGLSPHRAHHLLPYQTSGFCNVLSEDAIRQVLPDFGMEWLPTKNFWTERVPYVFHFCFVYPTNGIPPETGFWEEHLQVQGWAKTALYMIKGFIGIGSI